MSSRREPLAAAYRIDAVCDAFEAAWQASDTPPQIEDFLHRAPASDRGQLFRELLAVDLDFRRQRNESTTLNQVLQRFPEFSAEAVETVLARAQGKGPTQSAANPLAVGSQFGDFSILEKIGSGGMGDVYLAHQQSVQRLVALKVIRGDHLGLSPEEATTTVVDRFLTEAQAAAQLDQHGIVTVFETGELEGRHYLAMRYVAGESLSAMLREGPLDNHTAARYMADVAVAVAAAHEKGVLHRDLKPQNILIDKQSDTPWVADFGLAKLMESAAELTHLGDVLGTPQYMPPEQARDPTSVTSAADTYAIGATLYHLLTGRPPFQASTALQTVQQVLNDEPIPPRRLNSAIDRDLETICLKALAKRPGERYASTSALADDLQRYLERMPIRARRVGKVETLVRWCQRNPVVASLSATVLVSLLSLLAATTVGYITTAAAREASEAGFRDARIAIDRLVTSVREEPRFDRPELDSLRQSLLHEALRYYEQFLVQREEDPSLQTEVAASYYQVGLIREELGESKEALQAYEKARQLQSQISRNAPDDPTVWQAYGATMNAIGRVRASRDLWTESADAFRQAVRIRQRARAAAQGRRQDEARLSRLVISSQMNLGIVLARSGRAAEALRCQRAAQQSRLELLEDHPGDTDLQRDLALGDYNIGRLALDEGDSEQAALYVERARKRFTQILRTNPAEKEIAFRLAVCWRVLGDLADGYEAARRAYLQSLTTLEELLAEAPEENRYHEAAAQICLNLGQLEIDADALPAAATRLQAAAEILGRLTTHDPTIPAYRRDLGIAQLTLGKVYLALGQTAEAMPCLRVAERVLAEVVVAFPQYAVDDQLQEARRLLVQ